MTHNQTAPLSYGSTAGNNALFSNLIPLTGNVSPSAPLICIGQDLSIGQINLTGIFVSPAGQITIILSDHISEQQLSSLLAELQSWDCEKLDSIASDYTYRTRGQAFRIIDLMAERGHLTFSHDAELTKSINRCMRGGSFNLFRTSESD